MLLTDDEIKATKAVEIAVAMNEKQLKQDFYYKELPLFGICIFLTISVILLMVGKYMKINRLNLIFGVLLTAFLLNIFMTGYLTLKIREIDSTVGYLETSVQEISNSPIESKDSNLTNEIATLKNEIQDLKTLISEADSKAQDAKDDAKKSSEKFYSLCMVHNVCDL